MATPANAQTKLTESSCRELAAYVKEMAEQRDAGVTEEDFIKGTMQMEPATMTAAEREKALSNLTVFADPVWGEHRSMTPSQLQKHTLGICQAVAIVQRRFGK